MPTYEIDVYRDGRWWIPGEIEEMARDYIAVSTGILIDQIAVRIVSGA